MKGKDRVSVSLRVFRQILMQCINTWQSGQVDQTWDWRYSGSSDTLGLPTRAWIAGTRVSGLCPQRLDTIKGLLYAVSVGGAQKATIQDCFSFVTVVPHQHVSCSCHQSKSENVSVLSLEDDRCSTWGAFCKTISPGRRAFPHGFSRVFCNKRTVFARGTRYVCVGLWCVRAFVF